MSLTLDHLVDEIAASGNHPQARDLRLSAELTHRAYLPAHASEYAQLADPLPTQLQAALEAVGADPLWSHQAQGIEAARAGRDVLIVTPTASGKSLVFQLPVLESELRGDRDRALFLFPLKALGQDQRGKLEELAAHAGIATGPQLVAIYDGDTPRAQRPAIRADPPRVLISNPDMLHFGMLANPGPWAELFSTLRWIVLDEMHTYRGIFGSHFHHVLKRLLRLCRRHGSQPSIVASSATATNAADFAQTLAGRSFEVIERSGAPREGRHFLLFQPATSPYTTALQLFIHFVESGLKTIVFTKARRITELLHSWLKDQAPDLAPKVANYRAGFLSSERRSIEERLFSGELAGVISTSALEMGIDVGGLDACILVGFPGSMMATWQRSGRVGRQGRESLTALVALPDALDQYLLQRPDAFLGRSCEPLVISPHNDAIARSHLLCAAAELPLHVESDADYLEHHAPLVGKLLKDFELAKTADGRQLRCTLKDPHRGVALRGGGSQYEIVSEITGRTIGTVDAVRVLRECHPGAIYLHAGRQFLITELDAQRRRVSAHPERVEYFTTPLTDKETEILELLDHRRDGPLEAWLGRVRVTERVVGFERKRILSQERLGSDALELPPVEFETVALWFAAPSGIEETIREAGQDFMGALHAAEHAAISLFPALALCDRGDLGGISIPFHPQVGSGAIFIYDGHAGGIGIAESGFRRLPELLQEVHDLLDRCDCEDGCPMCVQSPKCGNGNRPLDKPGAQRLTRLLLGQEELADGLEPGRSQIDLEAGAGGPERRHPELGAPVNDGSVLRGHTPGSSPTKATPKPDLFDLGELPRTATGTVAEEEQLAVPGAEPRFRGRQRIAPPPRRTPIPRTIEKTILFDVETKRSAREVGGWHQLHRLGVALAVACDLEEGRFETFQEDEVGRLIELLKSADLVIGYNVMRFDYPVLSGYVGEDFRRTLPTLDLFESIQETTGSKIGLSHLTEATLGATKSADGLISLDWYKQGRLDLIEDYCRRDVELLRDLYLFGRREGYVCYRPKKKSPVVSPDQAALPIEDDEAQTVAEETPAQPVQIPVQWL